MGSYGTAGIVLNLAFKTVIYYEPIAGNRIYLLPLIMASGKVGVVLSAHVGKRAKAKSSANLVIANIPVFSVVLNTLLTLILAQALGVTLAFSLALVALYLLTLLFTWYCHQTIGGLVGDNLGFVAELSEIIVGIFLVSI